MRPFYLPGSDLPASLGPARQDPGFNLSENQAIDRATARLIPSPLSDLTGPVWEIHFYAVRRARS